MLPAKLLTGIIILFSQNIFAQQSSLFKADTDAPRKIPGMSLVWNDEFNTNGKPDTSNWKYETGFARNEELQWYQPDNAICLNGLLVITGRKQQVKNVDYTPGSNDWRRNREFANYTSSSLQTKGLKQWLYGRYEIRARIDTSKGSWPAIWTLGINGRWPSNGEIDIMEFYRIKSIPTILANVAWGTSQTSVAMWDTERKPLSDFTNMDPQWVKKFHVWSMNWTKDSINLFLDDNLINTTLREHAINPDGTDPFSRPHYLLLNLAVGANGGDPTQTIFPIKFEVDYVRVYQSNKKP